MWHLGPSGLEILPLASFASVILLNLSELVSPAPQAFLGMFAKLQKVAISCVMSVCLSICPRGTTWLILDTFS